MRQRVEQRALAGVGVAHQRDREHPAPGAGAPLHFAPLAQLHQLFLQHAHARCDHAAVEFDLLLARAAGLAEAAALALEVRPAAHQARRKVLELRQFHLQLAFVGLGALREDAQDQFGAVEDLAAEFLLEVALLARRQRVVEDHGCRIHLVRREPDLPDLAAARVELGIGPPAPAVHHPVAARAGAFGKARDLGDAFLVALVAEVEADEDRSGLVGGPAGSYGGGVEQTNLGAVVRLNVQVDRPRGYDRGDRVLVDHLSH